MTGSSMGCKKHISSFVYVHVCGRTGLTVCIKQQTENIWFASTTKLEPRDSMFSVVLVYIWDTGMCYGKIIHCVVLILPFPLCPSKHGKLLQPTGSCVQGWIKPLKRTCTRLELRYSAHTPRGWTRADTHCIKTHRELLRILQNKERNPQNKKWLVMERTGVLKLNIIWNMHFI